MTALPTLSIDGERHGQRRMSIDIGAGVLLMSDLVHQAQTTVPAPIDTSIQGFEEVLTGLMADLGLPSEAVMVSFDQRGCAAEL